MGEQWSKAPKRTGSLPIHYLGPLTPATGPRGTWLFFPRPGIFCLSNFDLLELSQLHPSLGIGTGDVCKWQRPSLPGFWSSMSGHAITHFWQPSPPDSVNLSAVCGGAGLSGIQIASPCIWMALETWATWWVLSPLSDLYLVALKRHLGPSQLAEFNAPESN